MNIKKIKSTSQQCTLGIRAFAGQCLSPLWSRGSPPQLLRTCLASSTAHWYCKTSEILSCRTVPASGFSLLLLLPSFFFKSFPTCLKGQAAFLSLKTLQLLLPRLSHMLVTEAELKTALFPDPGQRSFYTTAASNRRGFYCCDSVLLPQFSTRKV